MIFCCDSVRTSYAKISHRHLTTAKNDGINITLVISPSYPESPFEDIVFHQLLSKHPRVARQYEEKKHLSP